MSASTTVYHTEMEACVDAIVERTGPHVVFGSPFALGRPNHVLNGLYRRALADRGVSPIFPIDRHWNPMGHRAVADAMMGYLPEVAPSHIVGL